MLSFIKTSIKKALIFSYKNIKKAKIISKQLVLFIAQIYYLAILKKY